MLGMIIFLLSSCKKEKIVVVPTHTMEIEITRANTPGYYTINGGNQIKIGYVNSSPQLITFSAKKGDVIFCHISNQVYGGANYNLYLKEDGNIVINNHYYYTDNSGVINYTVL